MDATPPTEGGLLATVTRMLQTLRGLAGSRLELFLVEFKEERARMFDSLLLLAVGVVCGLMTLLLITFTITAVFWDTHRVLALTVLTAVYAVTATVAFVKLRSRLHRWQAYSATLEEFKKDCACFTKPK